MNKDLSPEKIFSIITELFSEPEKLKRMGDASRALGRPDAADTIADMVIGLAENGK